MKKRIVLLSSAFVASLIIGLTGCSKDDTTSPVVTLGGSSIVDVILNGTFTDAGATASDDEDGAVAVSTSGTVDVNMTGDYDITYTATDKAGNVGSATRTVHVYNQAEIFAGTYAHAYDSCASSGAGLLTPSPVVTASSTVNKRLLITNFGGLDPAGTVHITIDLAGTASASAITGTVPQNVVGTVQVTTIYPASKVVDPSTGVTSFDVTYQWSDGTGNDVCTTQYRR